jgi:arsenite/tail-anchored protein-transporting ATPase
MRKDLKKLLVPEKGGQKYIIFAGKGGVGKTSMACVTAVATARAGCRTLLLTTDPAAHIGNVLDRPVSAEVTPVEGVENLFAAKIDQKKATLEYKEAVLAEARAKFDECTVKAMEEELNSPCTEEMAAFQKFIGYMTESDAEVIIFDTAPTGHTLRLLELPMDWGKQLQLKAGQSTEISEADKRQKERFDRVVDMMKDPAKTTFSFVVYPEKTPIVESQRASQELASFGIATQLVVANLVIPEEQAVTPFFRSRRNMQLKYLAELTERFPGAAQLEVPMYAGEIKGLPMLHEIAETIF